jgi:hypothetical protein
VPANGAPSGGVERLDARQILPESIVMTRRKVRLELLPHERAALLKCNFTPQVREQLDACASSTDVATIRLSSVDVNWLASDLTHAIVKGGCRDQDVFDLSERLDYVDQTGDGSLDGWY